MANVNPQKGIEWFVRTAGLLASERPERWFLVVGALPATHDDYLAALRNEIARCGIPAKRFVFAGDQSDVEQWYPALDVKTDHLRPAIGGNDNDRAQGPRLQRAGRRD